MLVLPSLMVPENVAVTPLAAPIVNVAAELPPLVMLPTPASDRTCWLKPPRSTVLAAFTVSAELALNAFAEPPARMTELVPSPMMVAPE